MRDAGEDDLTALVGSRICHDLISPLGAICNGLELMQMSGAMDSPEMALVAESVENANARIRFFRIAFGAADRTLTIKSSELNTALKSCFQGRNIIVDWSPGDLPRNEAKLGFLALQCLESAMPYGGRITVSKDQDQFRLEATADRLAVEPQLWDRLSKPTVSAPLRPAQVQFGLLADLAQDDGWHLIVSIGETSVQITASPS